MALTNRTLVIMAKAPRPGFVKTRLAQSLPASRVDELYRCLLNDTVALARELRNVELAIMCPAPDVEDLARALDEAAPIVPQTGEGLVAGLVSVFAHFATGKRRVIAFDSDSPHLPVSVLKDAFDALEICDLVVGPTHDGGYYLVGAKASYPELFAGDGMGTANALGSLLKRARGMGLSPHLTEPFYDIDVAADLSRLAEDLVRAPNRAPRTAKWLSEWNTAKSKQRTHADGPD